MDPEEAKRYAAIEKRERELDVVITDIEHALKRVPAIYRLATLVRDGKVEMSDVAF